MRKIIIDAKDMPAPQALHQVLKEALNLPGWYGRNLDALGDCLWELGPVELCLLNAPMLSSLPDAYGEKLLRLFETAQTEIPSFAFRPVGPKSGLSATAGRDRPVEKKC